MALLKFCPHRLLLAFACLMRVSRVYLTPKSFFLLSPLTFVLFSLFSVPPEIA
jgi:hypothetical protein